MKKLVVLELFAGSCTFTKVARGRGHDVTSTDLEKFPDITYQCDIMNFDYSKVPSHFDVIWASPPCTGFSVAVIGRNWNKDCTPKTDSARLGIQILNKTIEIIKHYNPTYFFIENPRGMMRKMPIMDEFIRHTITYCQYGERRQKPTDIWTNSTRWVPREACKPRSPCHDAAPRGSITGTQGLKNAFERSKIPEQLCEEVIKSCED